MFQLLLLLPYLVVLGMIALNAWRSYLLYRDAPTRVSRDVSHEHRPQPAQRAAWGPELAGLGFERLGEVELDLPAVGVLTPLLRRTTPGSAWLLVDGPRTTLAMLTTTMVGFSTRLEDGSYVSTGHPVGEAIDEPRLLSGRVPSGLADAYRHHRDGVDSRTAEHGAPRRIASMADWRVHDRDYRLEHARRELGRPVLLRLLLPQAIAALLVTLVAWLSMPAIEVIARSLAGR